MKIEIIQVHPTTETVTFCKFMDDNDLTLVLTQWPQNSMETDPVSAEIKDAKIVSVEIINIEIITLDAVAYAIDMAEAAQFLCHKISGRKLVVSRNETKETIEVPPLRFTGLK